MRVIFMGTPDFSAPALERLHKEHEVIAVVTQPDKPRGRSGRLMPCPVKEKALELGLKVLQPESAREETFAEELKELAPDVIVVIAYGQILPAEILDLPEYGCVNVHASLLPKYRGAAPIQWAVINGDEFTGVTTMLMNEGLDTGDILLKKEVKIEEKETGGSLFEKLSGVGADLMIDTLLALEKGEITPEPQNEEDASKVGLLNKAMGELDFSRDAAELERLIRGLDPWPGAYTFFRGKKLSLWEADVAEGNAEAGVVKEVGRDHIDVGCGSGILRITRLQAEGKKQMSARDFLNGIKVEAGERLGR